MTKLYLPCNIHGYNRFFDGICRNRWIIGKLNVIVKMYLLVYLLVYEAKMCYSAVKKNAVCVKKMQQKEGILVLGIIDFLLDTSSIE